MTENYAPNPVDAFDVLQATGALALPNAGLLAASFLIPSVLVAPFAAMAAGLILVGVQFDDYRVPALLGAAATMGVAALLTLLFLPGTLRIHTRLARGETATVGMLASDIGRTPALVLLLLLVQVVVSVGFGMCFVPGVLLSLVFGYAPYVLIDQEKGVFATFSDTWSLVSPHLLMVFVLEIAMLLGSFALSCVTCGLGGLVVAPVWVLARAVMYQAMLNASGRF